MEELKELKQEKTGSLEKKMRRNRISDLMKYLIHFAGDMFHPLHMATRCIGGKCDNGGTGFPLTKFQKVTNLHELWDKILLKLRDRTMPEFEKGFPESCKLYLDAVTSIMATHPRTRFVISIGKIKLESIAKAMFAIAAKYAYEDISPDQLPSEKYRDRGYNVCRVLFAVAGYRLADYMREIFIQE
eukprot:TRINITY_DN4021_c0_g1_i3.p1 TRINITY_DN4021_c0_g1~~TRINITY_DN4021_c0_g1_i3.p1  ORF type:complete len:186 (-),score=9.30 TRINITY_DN4021_c0_g1_i3:164-721(-)